ncbi:SH3 domain-containing protein [Streptomyces megasporus]|uniref:SH3 domain-containing protein n=1 Tax=Streptomyces megasporus TaxID=44060 RepID=UPI000B285097|nr:SH3 domain-containing protein [Streptomyces megasporus]
MRNLTRRIATGAATLALLTGGAVAMAPSAAAVGSSACTKNVTDYNGYTTASAVHLRSGPSTGYTSKGLLYRSTDVRVYCTAKSGSWSYLKVTSGANSGKYGWVSSSYIRKHVRTCIPEDYSCHK